MRYLCLVAIAIFILNADLSAQDKVFPVAQEMPALKDCREIGDAGERRACSEEKIAAGLHKHLEYPEAALEQRIEGYVIVRFTVDEKGKTSDFVAEENPGFGMGEAAIEAVQKLGKWEPGKNRGEEVKVRMSVPVRFALPDKEEKIETVKRPDVYVIADRMPRFQGCGDAADESGAQACTFEKIMQYINTNLVIPEAARKAGAEGDVVVKFVVDTEGKVKDAKVVESLGKGCDEEALRLVNEMPTWVPGMMNDGQKVKVELTLPFRFVISDKE